MATVRFLLALYDSALATSDGNYWRQFHRDLSRSLLDRAYYEHLAAEVRHEVAEGTVIESGGFFSIDDQWCCCYQVSAAGRDSRGRPGRYLIACAFAARREMLGTDASSLLDHRAWEKYCETGTLCSPPDTANSELQVNGEESYVEPVKLRRLLHPTPVACEHASHSAEAMALCGQLPSHLQWHARWPADFRNGPAKITVQHRTKSNSGAKGTATTVADRQNAPSSGAPRRTQETLLVSAGAALIILICVTVWMFWSQRQMDLASESLTNSANADQSHQIRVPPSAVLASGEHADVLASPLVADESRISDFTKFVTVFISGVLLGSVATLALLWQTGIGYRASTRVLFGKAPGERRSRDRSK